jgi:hypothetical protein
LNWLSSSQITERTSQPALLPKGNRQNDVAQAILAGGGSATIAAVVRTAEIAHYRRIIASCFANGLSSSNFTQALRDLGTGGS